MYIPKTTTWITPIKKLAILMRDDFTCIYCGVNMIDWVDPNMITLDHVVSKHDYKQMPKHQQLQFGSINHESNLVTSCKPCNSSKKHNNNWMTMGAKARVANALNKPLNINLAKSIIENGG